jgi:hypothetical protein
MQCSLQAEQLTIYVFYHIIFINLEIQNFCSLIMQLYNIVVKDCLKSTVNNLEVVLLLK